MTPSPPHIYRPRLLLVDDVPANLRALSDLLPDHYEQQFASSGAEALQRLRQPPLPDLILLDVMMPDVDGYEVLREVRRWVTTRDIPVIFITALDDAHDEVLGLELGAADYITKPFDPAITLARIRKQLRRRVSAEPADVTSRYSSMFLSGASWTISYQGNAPFQIADRLGLAYLKILLAMPKREFSVEELIFLVVGKERERMLDTASQWLGPDRIKALYALSTTVGNLFSQALNPAARLSAIDPIEDLLGLLSDERFFERAGQVSEEDRDRFRKSIGNAIRRAIADIASYDPQLADHLLSPALRMGYRLVYQPVGPIVWL